jgi:hypothetical protein
MQDNDHHGPYLWIRTVMVLSKEESEPGNHHSAATQAEDIHTANEERQVFIEQKSDD